MLFLLNALLLFIVHTHKCMDYEMYEEKNIKAGIPNRHWIHICMKTGIRSENSIVHRCIDWQWNC